MSICGLGVSCEPITDINEVCEHGIVITFPCDWCLIQKQIIELRNRVEALHEHKIRQIDENRKISRRVYELEKLNQQCFDANPIKAIEERFEKLEAQFADFMQKSSLHHQIRPLRCPVCEGKGIVWG